MPMLTAFSYSVSKLTVRPTGFEKTFVGLSNYLYFFASDANFLRNLASSVLGMIPQTLLIVSFSIFLAVLIKDNFIGRSLVRSIFFFPVIIASGAVITILKQDVLMSSGAGAETSQIFQMPSLVSFYRQLNIPDNMLTLLTGVVNQVFDLTWRSGVQILLMLAAINNIPQSSYEVAQIEGATAWEQFWKITFPMISPSFSVVIIYTVIDSFTDYGNQVMTMLRNYYSQGHYSYSTTIGVIYFAAILLLIGVIQLILKKAVYYEK